MSSEDSASGACHRGMINNRRWLGVTSSQDAVADDDSVVKFRLATYNILSDNFLRDGKYSYCPSELRYMSSRHQRIIDEIRAMQPHVVCFQEVDYEHYTSRLCSSMKKLGYEGVLLHRQDDYGLATFWDTSVFQVVAQKQAALHHLAETHLKASELNAVETEDIRNAIDRPEAVLLVRLTTSHNNNKTDLVVANVHVTWSMLKYPALQALQASLAVNELAQFAQSTSSSDSSSQRSVSDCALVICGDFNSPPDTLPYQLLSRAHLDDVILDTLRRTCRYDDQVEKLLVYELVDVLPRAAFAIKTRISSAYKTVLGEEPAVTNCDDCGGLEGVTVHQLCLDYIWYCRDSLRVTGVLETPPVESITRHYALPSELFPSDHIPLLAEFQFTPTATNGSDQFH